MYRSLRLFVFSLGLGATLVAGCAPQGECVAYNDCPQGQYCSAGTCIDDGIGPTEPPARPEPGGRDGGPGGENVLAQVQTAFGVPWLVPHPTDSTRLLFPEQQVGDGTITVDTIRVLDLSENKVETELFADLTELTSGPCLVDQVHFDAVPGATPKEDWYHCLAGPPHRIVFGGDLAQPTEDSATSGAQLLYTFPARSNDLARVLSASRGGPLVSFRVQPLADGLGNPRLRDPISAPVSSVVAMFPLEGGGIPGDHLLVHNSTGAGGSLVPITRDPGTESWYATAGIVPQPLGADVHGVRVIAPVIAAINTSTPEVPNYLTVEPATGFVRYFRFETGQEILPPTQFETNALFLMAPRSSSERLMLEPTPSGSYLFYTQRGARKIWRLPKTPGGEQEVLQVELDDFAREITSIVPVSDDTAWISFGNENLLQKVRLIPLL
jgi:hypothetical protein